MRLILASLCGLVLVAGCSTVPTTQPAVQTVGNNCDYAQMQRVQNARQPILVERYWVHCPELPPSKS